MAKPVSKTKQAKLRKWLLDHGHKAEKLDQHKWDNEEAQWDSLLKLHGVKHVN